MISITDDAMLDVRIHLLLIQSYDVNYLKPLLYNCNHSRLYTMIIIMIMLHSEKLLVSPLFNPFYIKEKAGLKYPGSLPPALSLLLRV